MNENREEIMGDVKLSSPLIKKLENFWYHYKWHTIAAVAVVIIILVLTLQTCSRVSYDGYILYAGPYEIKKTSANGDIAPYSTTISSLKKACEDFDNDGNVNVTLQNFFVINEEEAEKLYDLEPGYSINTTLVQEDTERLGQTMLYGDYYVCFLSERIFLEYEERYGGAMFKEVSEYLTDGKKYDLASENGVYLGSLEFYSLPGICDLPADTVICLRALSEVSSALNRGGSEESFLRGEAIFKDILSFEG